MDFPEYLRPTSLMVTPSVDKNNDGVYTASEVGHVNGALTIGSTPYNWQALSHTKETKTGINTNSLSWTTTNPYGKDVKMNLVSSPSSEILIEKNVGRIGGYDASSEVFSPIVWFRTPAANTEYRVTALLSSYTNEAAKTANEIPVTGIGHAMKVHSSGSDDYIYTGKVYHRLGHTPPMRIRHLSERPANFRIYLTQWDLPEGGRYKSGNSYEKSGLLHFKTGSINNKF